MKYNITITYSNPTRTQILTYKNIAGLKAIKNINDFLIELPNEKLKMNKQIFYNLRKRPDFCSKRIRELIKCEVI